MKIVVLATMLALAACAQQPQPVLPDPKLTPDDVFIGVTAADLCVIGYTRRVRDVPRWEKEQVYREHGITEHHYGDYECDHLIPLELVLPPPERTRNFRFS